MVSLWDRLRGKPAGAQDDTEQALCDLFADYPPNPPLHAGAAASLSDAQHDANLADFLARRDERLAIIGAFLNARGADPAPMLDPASDGLAAAAAVEAWLNEALPHRPFSVVSGDDRPNPDDRAFRASDRSGKDIYFSFLADLGLLEGEAIRRHDANFDWAINRLPDFADIGSYQRICLISPGDGTWPATVLEMDEHMLSICHPKMAPRSNISGHRFGELLEAAITGKLDAH